MIAKDKFRVGDRVVLSDSGRRMRICRSDSGEVVGFGKDPVLVRVRYGSSETVASFHMDFWEPLAESEAAS